MKITNQDLVAAYLKLVTLVDLDEKLRLTTTLDRMTKPNI